MGQPRIVDVDYYVLIEEMKRASDTRCLIEKKDKERWKNYIAENEIREASLEAFGKVKFSQGKVKLVAISSGSSWDGCYAYSTDDEVALKYVCEG
ncbi:hypothetical protein [Neptunomonas sp.]|uniref:hypothetical protein n=1 Tax=Neptunomonas sp. TaxID=1971898 RepID=UPI0025CFE372|nr:hypothetical protein [Neptunomonas sp.]